MHIPVSTPLSRLLHVEGTEVLVHGVAIESPDECLHIVLCWCGSYWVDSKFGHISGPWTTLKAALRNTPAGAIHAGQTHDIVCPEVEPSVLASMMVLVGDGAPYAVTINGEGWVPDPGHSR